MTEPLTTRCGLSAGLIVAETRCDKGMQDNFALRAETTVELTAS
jgi:hypothetical protein